MAFKVWFIDKALLEGVGLKDVVPHLWQQAMPWEKETGKPRWKLLVGLQHSRVSGHLLPLPPRSKLHKNWNEAPLEMFSGFYAFLIEK